MATPPPVEEDAKAAMLQIAILLIVSDLDMVPNQDE